MGGFDLSDYLWPAAANRRQPDYQPEVNPSHPLAQYFSHVWVPGLSGADGVVDLLGNAKMIPFGAGSAHPTMAPSRHGMAMQMNGSTTASHTAAAFPGSSDFPITMYACGYGNDSAANYSLIKLLRNAAANGDLKDLSLYSGGWVGYYERENYGSRVLPFVATPAVGRLVSALSQSTASTDHRIYANGLTNSNTVNTGNPVGAYNTVALGSGLVGGLLIAAVGFRRIPDAIASEISRDPGLIWEMFSQNRPIFFQGAAAAAIDLAGNAEAAATGTASLTTQIRVAGAATAMATAGGALTTAINLAGVSASVAVAGGTLTVQIRLAGNALAQPSVAGALTTQIRPAGNAAAQASVTGALTTQIRLDGDAVAQALATAGLTTVPSGLSANAASSANATGALTTGIRLQGDPSAIAISSGGLSTSIKLGGAAAAVCNATGSLLVSSTLAGSALAQASAAAILSTQIKLNAAAVAQALAAGQLAGAEAWIDQRCTVRLAPRSYATRLQRRSYEVRLH